MPESSTLSFADFLTFLDLRSSRDAIFEIEYIPTLLKRRKDAKPDQIDGIDTRITSLLQNEVRYDCLALLIATTPHKKIKLKFLNRFEELLSNEDARNLSPEFVNFIKRYRINAMPKNIRQLLVQRLHDLSIQYISIH